MADPQAQPLLPVDFQGEGLLAVLRGQAEGIFPSAAGEEPHLVADAWLRWAQSDLPAARVQWYFLATGKGRSIDRDSFVLELWRSFDEPEGKNYAHRKEIGKTCHWDFYRASFFGWFLGRFNLPAALAIFRAGPQVIWLRRALIAAPVAAALTVLWLGHSGSLAFGAGALAAVLLLYSGVAIWAHRRLVPSWAFLQSLSPRLGAGVGIGYLFLASAPHLVQIIHASKLAAGWAYLVCAVAIVAAHLYVMHHIARRVKPPLPFLARARRSSHVVALGLGYAAAGLLLVAPLFFSPRFLAAPATAAGSPKPPQLALVLSIALVLGLILQLAWDEKPLTEPL